MKALFLTAFIAICAPLTCIAQCGHQFITTDQSWSYDAEIKYFAKNGALDTIYNIEDSDFLLLPICSTKTDYIATFTDDGHFIDRFIVMHNAQGIPEIEHHGLSRVILHRTK